MKNIGFPATSLLARTVRVHLRFSHTHSQSIVIAAAVRTPWGKYQGQLASLSDWQLGQIVVEAAAKRSAIPIEKIHWIFMNETEKLQQEQGNNLIFTNFLKKAKYTSFNIDANIPEVESLLKAFKFVKSQPQLAAIAGGFTSATNTMQPVKFFGDLISENPLEYIGSYVSKSLDVYKKSQSKGVFDAEIVPVKILKYRGISRTIEEIFHDEIFSGKIGGHNSTFHNCDGAVSVVLTSFENAHELKLSPLAVIADFHNLNDTTDILPRSLECLKKVFDKVKLQPCQIKHWEIDDSAPQLIEFLQKNLNLNTDLINPHGGTLISGQSPSTTFARLLTHIVHVLKPLEYGCVVSSQYQNSCALILQKLSHLSAPHHLPLITVYTMNHCPLCDILVEELELSFPREYELVKVFIDTKDNLRFLRLYRNDIPVVFLNNQFLCMHRLNHKLLRKQLNLLKTNNF